jgi:hypothetical protein
VITHADGSYDNYADDDQYRFNEHGMLVTIRSSTGERRTYSAAGWLYIEDSVTQDAVREIGPFVV